MSYPLPILFTTDSLDIISAMVAFKRYTFTGPCTQHYLFPVVNKCKPNTLLWCDAGLMVSFHNLITIYSTTGCEAYKTGNLGVASCRSHPTYRWSDNSPPSPPRPRSVTKKYRMLMCLVHLLLDALPFFLSNMAL
jgi:hypothetical protein